MIPNEQLTGLGLTLPPLPEPRATFAPWVKTGSLLFLSGAIGTQYTNGRWSLPYKGGLKFEVHHPAAYRVFPWDRLTSTSTRPSGISSTGI